MSAFKPSNNLLTDTILFEAIAKIRQESDYRREVESYVLEQNGLASVRQLSEDKKRLFTRIVDAIIAEGPDEIDPSMFVAEGYGMKREDHSPVNPGSYNTDAQPAAKLHNALGRHLAKNVKEGVMGDIMRHKVPDGQTRAAVARVPRAMLDVGRQAVRGAGSMVKNLATKAGKAGYEATKDAITTIGGGVAGAVRGKPVGPRRLGEGYHKMHEDDLQELSPELLRRAAAAQGRKRYQKDKRGNLPSYKAGDAMTDRMDKFEQGAKDAERRDELHAMTPRMRELYRKQGGRIPAGTDMRKPAVKEDYEPLLPEDNIFEEMIMESEAKAHQALQRMVSTDPKDNPVRARPGGGRFRKGERAAGTHYDRVFTRADLNDDPKNPYSRKGDEAVDTRIRRMVTRIDSRHGPKSAADAIRKVDENPNSMHFLIPNDVRKKYGAPRHQDVKR